MLNVYIADDEVWIILGLKKLLEKIDVDSFVVGTANNGLMAKEEIAMFKPDVIFTDIRMPGLSGLELLQAIPEVSPDSKVVIITGFAEFSYAKEAVQHHAFDYLLKPIKEEDLQRVMTAILKERGETEDEEKQAPVNDKMIDSVVADIRDHYMEDISLTSLAAKYNVSMGSLSKMIKEEDLQRVMTAILKERGETEDEEKQVPVNDKMIDSVVADIRDHYMEDISLTSLAAKYNVSMGSLSKMIKDHLQLNFSDYIASLRIQRAKELLSDETLSIQEIAEIVGYNDYFYFTKVFKKIEGISPSKYRKEI